MLEIPEDRARAIAQYIVEHGATVRAAAAQFHVSKSTVHKDVTVRIAGVDAGLARAVRTVLDHNREERHLRGGAATRAKYKKYTP